MALGHDRPHLEALAQYSCPRVHPNLPHPDTGAKQIAAGEGRWFVDSTESSPLLCLGRHQASLSRAIDRLASVVTDSFKSHSHFLQRAALVHNTCQPSVRRKHHRNPHIKRYATFAIGVFSPRFCDCRRCLLCTPSSPLTTLASSSSTCKVICFTRTLT